MPPEAERDRSYLLNGLARLQIETNQPAAARRSLLAAERGLPPDDPLHSHNAKVWGLYYAHVGDTERARQSFDRAIALLDPEKVADLDLLALHLTDRADFLATTDQPAAALQDYETVLRVRERLRRDVTSQGSRHRLSAGLRPILNRAIDLCYQQYRDTGQDSLLWKALQLSEWSRAYDLLRTQKEGPAAGREFELRLEAARLERESLRGDREAGQRLSEVRLELDRLVRTRDRSREAPPLPVLDENQLREFLGENSLSVYHLGDSTRGYRFTLHPGEPLRMEPINTAGLTELTKAWREANEASAYRRKSLRPAAEQGRLDSAFQAHGRELAERLRIDTSASITIPDGVLHSLSFAALPVGEDRYLGEAVSLSYGYSIATLLAQHTAPPDTVSYEHDLLAVAPSFAAGTLPTLPHAKEEVDYTCGLFANHERLVDDRANRGAFLHLAPHARLLHLSTHGRADLENPGLSHVAFHQTGGDDDVNQRLYYNELAAFRLPAELVVLSACETNVGRPARGETVLSLATAFTAAGARSTLTSLWQVDERATQLLLEVFYDKLAAGKSRRDALYEAQLTLRISDDYAHPFYWAGFVLHGNTSSLPEDMAPATAPAPYWWLLAGGIVAVVALTFARRKA